MKFQKFLNGFLTLLVLFLRLRADFCDDSDCSGKARHVSRVNVLCRL